jgi:hypothetical protein
MQRVGFFPASSYVFALSICVPAAIVSAEDLNGVFPKALRILVTRLSCDP